MHGTCNRRALLGVGAAMTAGLVLPARAAVIPGSEAAEELILWPGMPAGGETLQLTARIDEKSPDPAAFHARWLSGVAVPKVMVFRAPKPDGSAVLVIPGGGYAFLSIDNEGIEVARRLCRSGVTVFLLLHRLPREGWSNAADVPLQDAQRAMRLIRANAVRFGLDTARVGVLGFSAGGHVAASLATRGDAAMYRPIDAADAEAAWPAFAGLMYPVITMGEGTHTGSRDNLLGEAPTAEMVFAYSCEKQVSQKTPPCFICLSAKDDIVSYAANGLAMFESLRLQGTPAELHVFQDGKHGFGARAVKGTAPSVWPDLLLHWGYRNGWFRDAAAQPS